MKVLMLNPTVETGIIGFTLFKLKNMFTYLVIQNSNKLVLGFVMCAIRCPVDSRQHIDERAMLKLAV